MPGSFMSLTVQGTLCQQPLHHSPCRSIKFSITMTGSKHMQVWHIVDNNSFRLGPQKHLAILLKTLCGAAQSLPGERERAREQPPWARFCRRRCRRCRQQYGCILCDSCILSVSVSDPPPGAEKSMLENKAGVGSLVQVCVFSFLSRQRRDFIATCLS